MAPIKRKGASGEDPAIKNQKRARVASGTAKAEPGAQHKKAQHGKDVGKDAANERENATSVLREEEPSFPRGGGSVLTPLERKQIQNQATRDVLFEQKKSGKAPAEGLDEVSDVDVDMEDADQKPAPAKKSRKSKSKKSEDSERTTKDGARVEGLSFKVCAIANCIIVFVSY
jgi:rRNA biogenesis protein RRP5